jgi:FlaA1/EpsC-like NDP-sugar epimerase
MLMKKITSFSRSSKQAVMILADSILVITILFISFSFRLNTFFWPNDELLLLILISPIIALPIFQRFGLYRVIIRFIGLKALWSISKAASLYALIWGLLIFLTGVQGVPRSVVLINWLLTLILISGYRMFASWLLSEYLVKDLNYNKVVIYGSGAAGRELSNALSQSNEFKPVAFVDDDVDMHKKNINGLEVISKEDLEVFIKKNNVKEVLLAIPSMSRNQKRKIFDFIAPFSVNVRSLPSVSELTLGKVRVDDLLEIDIKDLLGRSSVKPISKLLKIKIVDKVILITGAGGSIGRELSRQIINLQPKKLILFDVSESALYQINLELASLDLPLVEILPILGSVRDENRIKQICEYYSVNTIYHAAAYKHVPLVEYNQSQGVLNNVIGTLSLANAAIAAKVDTFVLISTDKAVRPTNTMGATKRVAELILQSLSEQSHSTCFTMVRFGNVLDSSGSVIPLFRKQIKDGGPITVTDINVVRYFMTIPEAVELVIQAGAMGEGGDVFVLDMGEPIKIYDLAVKMIQLSGLQVKDKLNQEGDIEIIYTGLRPGEKLYEELLVGSKVSKTENKLIMRAEEKMLDWKTLKPLLEELKNASNNNEHVKIRELLKKLVPEFIPQSNIVDLVIKKTI